jgi:uncharacterized protein YutE (UPF0331/DUF86 family)
VALSDTTIRHKLQLLEGYVRNLRELRVRIAEALGADVALAWAVQHGLQLSIQCVIDVCQLLAAGLALGPPSSAMEAMELLGEAGAFDTASVQRLKQMARFRNVLVHAYAQVDLKLVHENMVKHLDDFGAFAAQVATFLSKLSGSSGASS